MAENFTKLILRLAEDPKTLDRLAANPEAVMNEHNLSAAEQAVLLAGDAARIRDTVAVDLGLASGPSVAAEWVIVLVNVQTTVKSIEAGAAMPRFSDIVNRFR